MKTLSTHGSYVKCIEITLTEEHRPRLSDSRVLR